MIQSAPVVDNQKERFIHLFHPFYLLPSAIQKECDPLLHKQRKIWKMGLYFLSIMCMPYLKRICIYLCIFYMYSNFTNIRRTGL